MKEQYLVLAELRRIDEKALRLHHEIEKIPGEISRIDKTIQTNKEKYQQAKNALDTLEKTVRKTEQDLKEKEDFISKAESKMMEVKNNDEYRAALKENENHKKDKAGIEDKILVLMNSLEAERTKLKTSEEEFKATETKLNQEKKEYEEERIKLLKYFEEQSSKRKGFTEKLTPDFSAIYEKAHHRMKGWAIEIVDNGQCQGCNMKVRPQLYNEVLGMTTLHKCLSCGRILIPKQIESELASS